METLPPFAFRKNLEQIGSEIVAGDWKIGAYVDLVSERRFLLFHVKSNRLATLPDDIIEFRGETAVAIAGNRCLPVVGVNRKETRLEILTPFVKPVLPSELDDERVRRLLRSSIESLAVFEKYCFRAHDFGLDAIGSDEGNGFVLMPNAYILTPAAGDDETWQTKSGKPDRPVEKTSAGIPAARAHVEQVAVLIRDLTGAEPGEGTGLTARRLSPEFRGLLAQTGRAVSAGKISTLPALHESLFGSPLDPEFLPFDGGRDAEPATDGPEPGTLGDAIGETSVIEISGPPASGKTTLLRRLGRKFEEGSGRPARWIDEWELSLLARKRGGRRDSGKSDAAWFVDDIDDKLFAWTPLFDIVLESGHDGSAGCLVFTMTRPGAPDELIRLLESVESRLGPRYARVDTTSLQDEAGRTGSEYRISRLLESISPGAPDDDAGVSAPELTSALLDALTPQEKQILELLSVSRIPLPHEIVLSVFSEANGELHRRIHHLAGVGLLQIDYRALPPTGQTSITLSIGDISLRRLIYGTINRERRENLHRTVARMAEDRGGVPTFFVFEHLVNGNERAAAAKYGIVFLKETPGDKRAAYLNKLITEFVDNGLQEELTFANRLYVLHELGSDLLAADRRDDAERLLLLAKATVTDAEFEDRRKNASLICDTFGLLADVWSASGNYSRALSLLTRTKESLNPFLSLAGQAKLLNEIGWVQYRLGDYDGAVESCKLSLNSLNANEHPLVVAQALNIMGVINFNTSRYDEAISYYERSAFLREREKDVNALSASYNNLGLAYQTKAEYDKALAYYQKSLEIKKLQNNRAGIAAGCLNLALMYLEVHNFEEAENNCRESLAISSDIGNTRLTAENYSTLGDIQFTRGHYEAAEEVYHKSLELARSLEMTNEEMGAHRRLAKLYLATNRYEEARTAVEKAARLGAQIGSRYENAQIETVLGDLNRRENRPEEAIQHYEAAANAYAAVSKHAMAAPVLARIGLLHFDQGDVFEAKQYLDRALDLIKSEIGREIPDEIVTLQQMLRERPIRGDVGGTESQKLLYAFYELSSLADYADDRVAFYKRAISVFQDLTGSDQCFIVIQTGEDEMRIIDNNGEQEPLVDLGVRALCTRALQLSTVLDSTSDEIADLRGHVQIAGRGVFVCVPMRAMGKNLGCLIVKIPESRLPLTKEETNFFTSLGRHIAGDVRLMLHLEEHAHKEETLEKQFETLQAQVVEQYRFENLIGKDESMKKIFRTLEKVKDMDTGLLIIGESGTGKTEFARTIHYNSPRRKHPFQHLHCAEIPLTLLESELFGHERGAFTGAVQRKLGRCEAADGGTVFLDDVNVVPSEIQTKLLHYLESKSFTRLGGTQKITTDVRIIAASNQDLEQLVKEGKFREDLYYRLKVILIHLPPLRERKEDMIAIAQAFLKKRCQAQGKSLRTLSSETIKLFQKYHWPGNVRELQNILEQVVLLSDDDIIAPSSLPEDFLKNATGASRRQFQSLEALAEQMVESGGYSEGNPLMPQLEALLAMKMAEHVSSKSKAAGLLGITKPTLYSRLRGYEKLQ